MAVVFMFYIYNFTVFNHYSTKSTCVYVKSENMLLNNNYPAWKLALLGITFYRRSTFLIYF